MWYVQGLENPAADACSCLTLSQLMDIKNATPTRVFVVPLVENSVSYEGEPVHEFLHLLEHSFSHNEVWPQPYDHLYVSLRNGRSVGKDPDVHISCEPVTRFATEPAVEPEELEPLPADEALAQDSHEPAARLEDTGNKIPDMSTDTDDLPEVDMDRPLRVTFGKEPRYAPTLTELICCRRHRDGTLQPASLPKFVRNTPCLSSPKGTQRQVHRHYQCKDLTSRALWAAAYREDPRRRHIYESSKSYGTTPTPRCKAVLR